jgi:hypothetical protein
MCRDSRIHMLFSSRVAVLFAKYTHAALPMAKSPKQPQKTTLSNRYHHLLFKSDSDFIDIIIRDN